MATIVNVTATIENLNQIGTISPTSTTFSSATTGAIPFDNVGLYQIMDKLVSEVLTVKNTIKTNEKNLIKDLAIEPDDDTTVTLTNSVGTATHESSISDHKARNRLVDAVLKPAIFESGTSFRYSEDGLFTMFSSITYEIMKLRNGLAAANNGGVSANAGLQPIPVSTGTV
jgi:hypothetical protein